MAPNGQSASKSLWQGVQGLQLGAPPKAVARKLSFTEDLARKLCLEATLHGHTGCVNRLAWSEDGTLLVSGSDDRSMRVWRYMGDGAQQPLVVDTLHQGNIFGVAFLPATDNRELVSGAMDYSVQHHVMEAGTDAAQPAGSPVRNGRNRAHPSSAQQSVSCRTTSYTPHKGRIKDVEVAPGNPNQFWSASEDGSIREYDKRCTTASQRDYNSANVLLEVTNKGRPVELKGVAVNRVQPHQLAVAAGDCHLRLYDRRMLNLTQPSSTCTPPVLSLAPPHLDTGSPRQRNSVPHGTYVQFGNRGDKLIATYHGDHAYTFDVTASEQPPIAAFRLPAPDEARPDRRDWVTSAAEEEQGSGILAATSGQPHRAVSHYSRALRICPNAAMLYLRRAWALQQRGWVGDAAFALRDCECVLALDSTSSDAMLLRAQLLLQLGQLEAANQAAEACEEAHPGLEEDVARVYDGIEQATDEQRKELEGRAADLARRQMALQGNMPQSAEASDAPNEASIDSRQPAGHSPPAEHGEAASQPDAALQAEANVAGDDPIAAEVNRQLEADWQRHRASPNYVSRSAVPAPPFWDTAGGRRLLQRYIGHCNCATDIKEAAFLGQHDDLVACGSDDGRVFIYSSEAGELVQVLQADEDVANCVKPHPSLPLLATSGIESVIRLWSPGDTPAEQDMDKLVHDNQERMREGPQLLRGINPRIMQVLGDNQELLQMLVQRTNALPVDDAGEEQQIECRVQ